MILGVDYGEKRIGTALADEELKLAFASDAVIYKSSNKALELLEEIINKNSVSKIVMGLPLGFDSKPTQKSEEVKKFASQITQKTHLDVIFWNETFTTKIASKNVKSKRNGKIDSESARIILQEYLDNL